MPLFKVSVTFDMDMVVEAEDEDHAWEVAHDDCRNCLEDTSKKPWICVTGPVNKLSDMPRDWDGMCIPYGGDGNTRIKDLVPE